MNQYRIKSENINRKSIYIFGAHSRARTLAVYLTELYPDISIEAFLTNNTEENPTEINGVPVLNLSTGITMNGVTDASDIIHTDIPVFIGTRGVFHAQISEHLRALGFTDIYPVTVELDLHLRNDFLKCYFAKQGRDFAKIDDFAGDSNRDVLEEVGEDETDGSVAVYVAKSIFDKSLTVPYELASYEKEIQVGAALTQQRLAEEICVDNVGDNISHKNKQYCELTALYWIWKNVVEDIIGLVHYRRHFILPKNWQQIMVERGIDVILPVPLYVEPSLETNYKSRHDGSDLDYLFEYVRRQDEAEYERLKQFFGKGIYSPCNMFIMRKDVLCDLCEWMFPLLDAVVAHGGQKEDSYLNRYPGFLSERLLSYFFEKNRDKYKMVYADKNFLA